MYPTTEQEYDKMNIWRNASMTTFRHLECVGVLKKGDVLLVNHKGKRKPYIVKEVLFPGKENEEIIINKKKNKYFITSMAVDGSSWAKNVMFVSV